MAEPIVYTFIPRDHPSDGQCELLQAHLQMNTKVLLVEDDPLTRHMVRQTLKNNCCFATAPTAHVARLMIAAYHPDIVILDLGLPDQNGATVFDWIMEYAPNTQVIIFTSAENCEIINQLLQRGARTLVNKPFSQNDLLDAVYPN